MTGPLTPDDGPDAITQQAAMWFARLRADDLSRDEQQRFEHWLTADPAHATAFRRFEQLWRGAGQLAGEPVVTDHLHDIAAAAAPEATLGDLLGRAAERYPAPPPRRRRWPLAAAAAVVVIGLGVALPTWLGGPALRTEVGEQRSMALADGTRVTLNTDSRLRVRYDGERRSVHLDRGQAYFQVAKEHRPFEVITGDGVVRALGTAFDVYRKQGDVIVTVIEGTVMVSGQAVATPARAATRPAAAAAPPAQILHAQQRVALSALNSHAAAEAVQAVPAERSVAWLRGQLVFDDEPLTAATAEINRYSPRQVRIGDPHLGALRMSGVYRIGEVSDFVSSVSEYFALRVEVAEDGGYVLYGRGA